MHTRTLPRMVWAIACLVLCLSGSTLVSLPADPEISYQELTADWEQSDGFFPFYWDSQTGRLLLEITRWNEEFLYLPSLQSGVGSNPLGLDRGLLGTERVVKFIRQGPKVLLIAPNLQFRARSQSLSERQAVNDSFAQSVIWGFESEAIEDERCLIDLTPFLLHDALHIANQLEQSKEGNFKIDTTRSAILQSNTKNFPKNSEFEALLTFSGSDPGPEVRSVTPHPNNITVRLHHSFVELPGPGFQSRDYDPRSASFIGASFLDYATAIDQPIQQRFIARHRLQKQNPAAPKSPPVEPIVYYLDPGVPEPIRSALLDGALWWNDAFTAIGYEDAFQVRDLPPEADPMDIRYNLIQWVHRETRGWSYGMSVVDPRTGEIIKGKVSLGSQRVRQDFLITQGLLSPYRQGATADPQMTELALARLRQLSAHEVGHTLGFRHNFAASASGRSSVMDYPHPVIRLNPNGEIDLSDAYDIGVGNWDKVCVAYAYQTFTSLAEEQSALNNILEEAYASGLRYISDQDARPQGGAHPTAHLWDNGTDATAELERVMTIRNVALKQISTATIRPGAPLATIEEALVPIYLFHRYQTEAVSKLIGGLEYDYTVRGGPGQRPAPVRADTQRSALRTILQTISPEFLTLPDTILELLPPRPPGYPRNRETFPSRLGVAFDPIAAAEVAANETFSLLLNAERANRLTQQSSLDDALPSLRHLLNQTIESTWKAPRLTGLTGEVQRAIEQKLLLHLFALAASDRAHLGTRGITNHRLELLKNWLQSELNRVLPPNQYAHLRFAVRQIEQFEKAPNQFKLPKQPRIPDGSPIGVDYCHHP